MSKRRFIVVATLVVVLALSVSLLVACNNENADKGNAIPQNEGDEVYFPDNFVAVDYTKMEEVADMDSFDLLCEVYDRWITDSYKRVQYFSFEAKPLGASITNFAKEIYKVENGTKVYRTQVVIQDGKVGLASDKYQMERFYFDGTNAKYGLLDDTKDKTIIPGDPKHKEGLFYTSEIPAISDYTGEDIEERVTKYTTKMCDYDWRSKDRLSNTDYKVYKDEYGNLRFTITVSPEMLLSSHPDAIIAFENGTGGKDIELKKPTTIDYVVKKIDGVNKIVAWRRTEDYQGRKGAVIPAKQTCVETFSYAEADYKITPEDIA